MKLTSCFSILLLVSFSARFAFAEATPSSVLSNYKGIEEMKKSNPSLAQEKFLNALTDNPFDAKLHLNLGVTYEVLGQGEKAQAAYETANKLAQDAVTKFAANYNLGELAQKAKKTDEALHHYQEALKYNPESKETKTNIELLIQDPQGKGQGKDNQENKDKDKDGQGKDQKDSEGDQPKDEKDEKKENKPKEYAKNKPQPKKFKSEELSQADVNKIFGEIKRQEQKIRAEFNKKETKERPRDKDW